MTHYVVARSDLPSGLKAAQVDHASGESSPGELPHGTHVVVLEAHPEQLAALAHDLARAGIPHAPIIEIDPPYENQLVALGIDPRVDRRALKPYLSSLPLLGKKEGAT